MGRHDYGDEEPMLTPSFYEQRNRPFRDTLWSFLFAVTCALTVAGGIYAGTHR
jgi:hypothetical protein